MEPTPMLEIAVVLTVGFLPCVISLVLFQQQQQLAQARLHNAIAAAHRRQLRQLSYQAVMREPIAMLPALGRPDCRFSAHSAHLRCAVNPMGDCHQCRYFESWTR
jgi:hypothetical protein